VIRKRSGGFGNDESKGLITPGVVSQKYDSYDSMER